jgi:hypothetical protein
MKNYDLCTAVSTLNMRHSTKSIAEKLSQKKAKTAKHFTVELVFME